ncbi:MAG: hypothetical protein ACK518_00075 [bacterium]
MSSFKEYLKRIWFDTYERGKKTKIVSSGFKHVFLGTF